MKKIKVKICRGEACTSSGGLSCADILDRLPPEISDGVKVKEKDCLDLCEDPAHGEPPFVKVKGRPLATSSASEVIEEVVRRIRAEEAPDSPGEASTD